MSTRVALILVMWDLQVVLHVFFLGCEIAQLMVWVGGLGPGGLGIPL